MERLQDGGEWEISGIVKANGESGWRYKGVMVLLSNGKHTVEVSFRSAPKFKGGWFMDRGVFIDGDWLGSYKTKDLPRAVKRKIREAYALVMVMP